MDTGPKLNVDKMFRRRLGHLLNVLCTFYLRPVSTGFKTEAIFTENLSLAESLSNPARDMLGPAYGENI